MSTLSKFSTLVLTAIGIGAVSLALTTTEPGRVTAAPSGGGGGPQQVLVVNGTTQPLPTEAVGTTTVTGSVSLEGTPSVSLAGSPSVTVAGGTIEVTGSGGAPLRVQIDRGQPFSVLAQWTTPVSTSGTNKLAYTVPAGQRFVVDHISFQGYGGSNKPVRYHVYGADFQHVFVAPQMDPTESFGEAILSQQVSLEFGPGAIYVTDSRRDYGSGSDLFNTANLSGHLIDDI